MESAYSGHTTRLRQNKAEDRYLCSSLYGLDLHEPPWNDLFGRICRGVIAMARDVPNENNHPAHFELMRASLAGRAQWWDSGGARKDAYQGDPREMEPAGAVKQPEQWFRQS